MKKSFTKMLSTLTIFTVSLSLFAGSVIASGNANRTLTIGTNLDILSVDPQLTNAGGTSAVLFNVYSRLMKQDTDMSIILDLATKYEMVDDLTWVFTLRDDVTFHNGDKFTAADMEFSLNRVSTDAKLGEKIHFDGLAGVRAIDDTHLEVKTKAPMPTLLSLLAKSGSEALPKKYIEEKGWDYFLQHPVGTGPYQLESYVKDDRVTLVPYPKYYGTPNPDWDKVVFRVIPEVSTRVGELLAGNVSIVNSIIPTEWDRINNNPGTAVQYGPSSRTYQIALKTNAPFPTADIRVRKAIDYAINDKLIVDQILRGAGRVMLTRIPEGVFGNNPKYNDAYNYDPKVAKELLAEAGYPNGFALTLQAPNGSYLMDSLVAQAVAAMLGEVGIKVDLELMESSAWSNVYNTRTPKDAFLTCFGLGFFDSAYGLVGYTEQTSKGMTNWADKTYNELFIKARSNMNPTEREKEFQTLQDIIAEERPYVCMLQITVTFGVADNIAFKARLDEVFDLLKIRRK
ncbi:MAG: ABC transporter substrate-binding protein [Fusobacteriaceae bacterium]|jgi:peptide/nickel transport system substrate-binding protein|nr:ABC transporter substrate-binding protein [Fusobacteriaceae bacterium]